MLLITVIFHLESNYLTTFNVDCFSPALLYGGRQGSNSVELSNVPFLVKTAAHMDNNSQTQVLIITKYKKMNIVQMK